MTRTAAILISGILVVTLLAIGGVFVFQLRTGSGEGGIAAAMLLGEDEATPTSAHQQSTAERSRANLLAEFDLTNLRVDEGELIQGTSEKDQIVAIVDPDHSSIDSINELSKDDRMIAVTTEGETVGYPLTILTFREIINDHIADTPIAVTY